MNAARPIDPESPPPGVGAPHERQALPINRDRLWDSLMELATIGATPKGGVCRPALTDLDKTARDRFRL